MSSLEDKIGIDNPIRFIYVFVERISLEFIEIKLQTVKNESHQSFP
jgi:hypothetical protein